MGLGRRRRGCRGLLPVFGQEPPGQQIGVPQLLDDLGLLFRPCILEIFPVIGQDVLPFLWRQLTKPFLQAA